ncbi:MAG: hypothetical protein LBT67_02465 [Holosporaceae bacterium]|jgi:hypothetical protein|nr:hypothetical protein [Holosporaceae bacterium]
MNKKVTIFAKRLYMLLIVGFCYGSVEVMNNAEEIKYDKQKMKAYSLFALQGALFPHCENKDALKYTNELFGSHLEDSEHLFSPLCMKLNERDLRSAACAAVVIYSYNKKLCEAVRIFNNFIGNKFGHDGYGDQNDYDRAFAACLCFLAACWKVGDKESILNMKKCPAFCNEVERILSYEYEDYYEDYDEDNKEDYKEDKKRDDSSDDGSLEMVTKEMNEDLLEYLLENFTPQAKE